MHLNSKIYLYYNSVLLIERLAIWIKTVKKIIKDILHELMRYYSSKQHCY